MCTKQMSSHLSLTATGEHACSAVACSSTETLVKGFCGVNVCVLDDVGTADCCPHPRPRDQCGVTPASSVISDRTHG